VLDWLLDCGGQGRFFYVECHNKLDWELREDALMTHKMMNHATSSLRTLPDLINQLNYIRDKMMRPKITMTSVTRLDMKFGE
jgi:hypothetical protein